MWLTGFDAPSLHTMYLDKPMRGHGLMQAIARVNRVFKDKPGGLVVDYLGLADELKQALATYTESGGTGQDRDRPGRGRGGDAGEVRGLLRAVPRVRLVAVDNGGPQERLGVLPAAQEHILAQEDGKNRLFHAVTELSQGLRPVGAARGGTPHPGRCRLLPGRARGAGEEHAPASASPTRNSTTPSARSSRKAVASGEVVDIFAAAGLKKPDISILSDEFLAEVRGMPQRNLAVELLQKLLNGEIEARRRTNVVQARSFAEMLEQALRTIPEPGHRDRPGHRGTDCAGQGDAGGRASGARSSA